MPDSTAYTVSTQARGTFNAPLACLGFETVTVDATSGGVPLAAVPTANSPSPGVAPPVLAVMDLETGAIRYRVDGGAPTATVGHPLAAGQQMTLGCRDFSKFRAIRQTGTSGTLTVTYWG